MLHRTLLFMALTVNVALAGTEPAGLLFHATFDKLTTDAEVAGGDKHSTFAASLELRPAAGIRGAGLLQRLGERCSWPIQGNFDTSQGTFVIWVKPLNWDGHSKKFRHLLCATPDDTQRQLIYLYPVGDESVFNYINYGPKDQPVTWRAGAPVDMFKKGEWTCVAATWDSHQVRLYANGRRVGDGKVSSPIPKKTTGTFTICPVQYWAGSAWSDADEQTVCDEVRVFDHALTDDQILDLYAVDLPGGVQGLKPALTLSLSPRFFDQQLLVTVRPAHLDRDWEARLARPVPAKLTVTGPGGAKLLEREIALSAEGVAQPLKVDWQDGDYRAVATVTVGGQTLQGETAVTKPPTPWLPRHTDWLADRVLPPWTPLRAEGSTVHYWRGDYDLTGGLPTRLTSGGADVLAAPINLRADQPATWDAPRVVESLPQRVTVEGRGQVGPLGATCRTVVEFDGLCRADLTLTPPPGGADLKSLTLELPLRADMATWYRNPKNQEWNGQSLDEPSFLPYAWLGNTERGLSWFLESDANQVRANGQPAMTIRREGDRVVVRLHWISQPVRVTSPLRYTFGCEPTPVRPMAPEIYNYRFASGPQFKGSNRFVYGWDTQICDLNARLIATDPANQRKLIDNWRKDGKESLSYSCTQCTASLSPEYLFFGDEWNQPYGATFAGYQRGGDKAPYSMVPTCPASSFADFLVWCAREHVQHDWGGGVYTDIDGAIPCDNPLHGCGFTDAFGRSGRTYPLYAHRALSRRLYAACHDAGKLYFAHAHSEWYAPFNAFNDGWCPGEQYSSAVMGKPRFYMDDIPDRVWRSEFYSPTTGVMTFLLPELDRLSKDLVTTRGPSETLMAASLAYGVPLWAGSMSQAVVEEVWAAQMAFGMTDVTFVPFWKQTEITASDAQIRVSAWVKGGRRLLVLANFGDQARRVTLRSAAGFKYQAAWNAPDLAGATVTVPAKSGLLLVAAP